MLFFNKLHFFLRIFCFAICVILYSQTVVSAHDNIQVHPHIVEQAFILLKKKDIKDGRFKMFGREDENDIQYVGLNYRDTTKWYEILGDYDYVFCNEGKDGSTLTEGAKEEDDYDPLVNKCNVATSDIPNGDLFYIGFKHHYYDPDIPDDRNGLYGTLFGNQNRGALSYAKEYWEKAKILYQNRETRGKAYYYLGRIAHLLADMSVPAHVHNDSHGIKYADGKDSYEDYIVADKYLKWGAVAAENLQSIPSNWKLDELFKNLAEHAQYFPSDNYRGINKISVDNWPDVTKWEIKGIADKYIESTHLEEIGNYLMPLAIQYTAHLYKLFWDEVNPIPDAVSVNTSSDTTWKDSPHSLDVSSKNAEKIYCKVSIKTDGSEPDDPQGDPSAESHDAFNKNMDEFINGSSGKFEMYADPGQIKRIKVKFRGWNANDYGPTSQVYSYTIDLRQTEPPKVTPPGAVSVSPKSSSDSWETSPQYVKLNCPNAEVIYCTVRLSKDGTAPKEDPPEPTVEAHDAFNENMDETVGPTGKFEVWGKAGEYKVIKVRFRGYHSKNGYGPSTPVYTYRLDLTDADSGDSSGKEKKPDIVVRDLYLTSEEDESTPRTTFLLNQPIRIFTRVKNIGKADANKDIRIEYSLSPGTEISPNHEHIGDDDITKEKLKKGADKKEDYHYSSDDPLPKAPGIYNITVRVDTEDKLDESNENNNEFNPPLVFEVIDPNAPPTDQLVSGIDTALIIDSSGSMSDNDPKNYRLEAARFFIDRAEDSDYIAVVDFDSGVYVDPEKGTFRIAKDNRNTLKEAVSLINADGGTNISAGLNMAYDQLGFGDPNTTKIAILLTDGDGTYNNEASLYQAKGWRIFTIGLGEGVNEVLLKKVASDTGGEYFKVTTEEAARNAITQIYQIISRSVHAGEQIVRQEQFRVFLGETVEKEFDVPAGTTSLWVDRIIPGSDVELVLIQPDGKVIDRNTTDPNVYHSLGATYEIYRVNNPMPGKWKTKLIGIDTLPDGEPTTLSISINNPEAAARELKNSHEQTVYERSVVTLDGTKSAYSNKIIASYQWTMAGKAPDWIETPKLSDPNSPNPTFTAPEVGKDGGSMVFQLIVTDSSSRQSSDVYNVKINNVDSDLADDAEEGGLCFISSAGNAPDRKGFWLLMAVFAVFVLVARKTQRNQRQKEG